MSRQVNLGHGHVVPYPRPSSPAATRIALANPRKDTAPETVLRSQLHAQGLRFRKDLFVRAGGVRCHVDVAFTRRRVAVFVDGCFWHCCPDHFHMPRNNAAYWVPKFEANVARDRRVSAALTGAGWRVLRVWEHDVPGGSAAERVTAAVDARR